jgi:hypothetical protein
MNDSTYWQRYEATDRQAQRSVTIALLARLLGGVRVLAYARFANEGSELKIPVSGYAVSLEKARPTHAVGSGPMADARRGADFTTRMQKARDIGLNWPRRNDSDRK